MVKDGHEYCVQNGYNRSHVGRYVYAFATAVSWLLIYALLKVFGDNTQKKTQNRTMD